jgi:hypothetical protein
MQHSVNDLPWHLSSGGVVEIRATTTVIVHIERREQWADVVDIQTQGELPELTVVAVSHMPAGARATITTISNVLIDGIKSRSIRRPK